MIHSKNIISIAMGAVAAALVLMATSQYGIGISPDSIGYVLGARSLANGKAILPLAQPPFYPILLAFLAKLAGYDPVDVARVLGALTLGATVTMGSRFLSHVTNRKPLLLVGSFALLGSVPLFVVSTMAWTEPIFNLLVLTVFFALSSYIRRRSYSFTVLALASAAAILTRYVGYTLLLTVMIALLILRTGSLRAKSQIAVLYGAASSAPAAAWMFVIWRHIGTPVGARAASLYSLHENLAFTTNTIWCWFLPDILSSWLIRLAVLGVLIAVTIYVAITIRHHISISDLKLPWTLAPVIFIVVYLVGLISTSTSMQYDPIGDRLLSPIYVPLILVTVMMLDQLCGVLERNEGRLPVQRIVALLFAAVLLYPTWSVVLRLDEKLRNGAGGFNTRVWRESPTLKYLQANPLPGYHAVYSNQAEFLTFFGEIESGATPVAGEYDPDKPGESGNSWAGEWPDVSPAYLIWFNNSPDYLVPLDGLSSIANVKLIKKLDDGTIYLISRQETQLDLD